MTQAQKALTGTVEYLTQEEFEATPEEQSVEEIQVRDWDQTMALIAQPNTVMRIPRNKDFTRKDVVGAFINAFELIGGTPRLALWAHQNETDFYKLYSRLLPSQASQALGEANEIVIKHVLPRGPLDE